MILKVLFKFQNISKSTSFEDYYKKIKSSKIYHFDLLERIPFESNTVNYIYSSHFFEHVEKKQLFLLLKECYRVLKREGLIRIAIPSLEEEVIKINNAVSEYYKRNFENIQQYLTSNDSGFIDSYSKHKYMYNFAIMKDMLQNAGFSNIKEYDMYEGEMPDVKKLDTRKSLFLEARKVI